MNNNFIGQLLADGISGFSPEITDLITSAINQTSASASNSTENTRIPYVLTHSPSRVVVYAEMPGFEKKSISLDFYNNHMSIKGDKSSPSILDDEKVIKSSVKYGHYNQNIPLPVSVTDRRNVSVQYENGFLQITINLAAEENNRFTVNID